MNQVIDVVKHKKRLPVQSFQNEKLYKSIYAACLSVRVPDGEAAIVADRVSHSVQMWLKNKPMITSNDLRRIASVHLHRYNPDAAYFYHHHRYII